MRLRRQRADPGDYDSVLDTMTNVIGILIIVVAVTQLNVSSAVGRARASLIDAGEAIDHPPVPDDVLAAARRTHEETAARLVDLRSRSQEAEGDVTVQETEWRELLRRLQQTGPPVEALQIQRDITRTRKELQDLEAEVVRLKRSIEEHSRRVQELKGQIEALKGRVAAVPPSLRMRLPDPSAGRVEGLDVRPYLVKKGRVYEWDVTAPLERWQRDAAEDAKRVPGWAGTPGLAYPWLARTWSERDYQNDVVHLDFRAVQDPNTPDGWDIILVMELREGAPGTTLADLRAGTSAFHRQLRRLSPEEDWIYFRVFDDSFETYIVARGLAEEGGFAVGWIPYAPGQIFAVSLHAVGSGQPPKAD